jgi:hypothetical protein
MYDWRLDFLKLKHHCHYNFLPTVLRLCIYKINCVIYVISIATCKPKYFFSFVFLHRFLLTVNCRSLFFIITIHWGFLPQKYRIAM